MVSTEDEVVIPEITTFEFPAFFKFTASVSDFPFVTFPKFKLAGVTASTRVAAAPCPLKETVSVLSGALLEKAMPPLFEPVEDGVNCTVQIVVCPAVRLRGYVSLHSLKSEDPVRVAPEMLIVEFPVFFN